MSDIYRFSMDEQETAKSLINNYETASVKLLRIMPKAEMKMVTENNKEYVRFHWVAVGEKYYHPIYLFVYYEQDKDAFILINKPKYPAYLLGFIGSMVLAGLHPAVMMNNEMDIRAVVVSDIEKALLIASEGLKHGVISGRKFLDFPDISYEGFLYETPIGFISFLNEKPPFKPFDIIKEHSEYNDWIHPIDITKNYFYQLIPKLIKEG